MNLSSEQVHWIGGAAFTTVAVLLFLFHGGVLRIPWVPYLLPLLLIGYGIESFLDPLVHGSAIPKNYAAETAQHRVQGSFMLLAGIVEWLRLRGRLQGRMWALPLPLALSVLGLVFIFHAQHEAMVPPLVLSLQHRFFALALWMAAAAKVFEDRTRHRASLAAGAWLLPLLVFGLAMLAYTEGGTLAGHAGH
jgi:hypothetical protein